jgi:translocon-associated protein subunit gamma
MVKKLTKEEELLLQVWMAFLEKLKFKFQDFSRNVSTKSSALFYGNALIMATIPLWLFWRVHQMEFVDYWLIWILGKLRFFFVQTGENRLLVCFYELRVWN